MGERAGGGRRRTAVLISGRGSNLAALAAHCARPGTSAQIALVIADRPAVAGLDVARATGIPSRVVDRRAHDDRDSFESALDDELQRFDTELACLAGFMQILSPALVARWRDRMLNIHPSLLPAFPGLDTHRRALEAGVRVTGCTVHLVRAEVDAGPILVQGAVPVRQGDTPLTLAARVLTLEHRCYPLALELVAAGHARIEGERVVLADAGIADAVDAALISPPPQSSGMPTASADRALASGPQA